MFNKKGSSQDEALIKDLRQQLKERDERIQSLSSALTDAHDTVKDLEDALAAAGATIGMPNPQMWRDVPGPNMDRSMRFGSPVVGSPMRRQGSVSLNKETSILTQSGLQQQPLELSGTFIDSQQYFSTSYINSEMYDMNAYREDLQAMQNQLASKDRQIEELMAEVAEWRTRVRTVNMEYDSFRKTILDMSICNSDLRQQLSQAQEEIENNKATIEALLKTDAQQGNAFQSLMASMESRDKVAELLSSVNKSRMTRRSASNSPVSTKEVEALRANIKEQEQEIARLHEMLTEKETEIAHLVATCEETTQLNNDIQTLLDHSIQTNQLLKDKIETMAEEARISAVQSFQTTNPDDQVQQIATDSTSVPFPIYLHSSRNSKDDVVDATIVQLQSRVAELETELAFSLSRSPAASNTIRNEDIVGTPSAAGTAGIASPISPEVATLLTSKDEEISLLKKQVRSLEQSLLAADTKQSASQHASPVGSRAHSPRGVAAQASFTRDCFSEIGGGARYLKLMKRTRLLIDEASDVLSGTGNRHAIGASMSISSHNGTVKPTTSVGTDAINATAGGGSELSTTELHLRTIAELREANAQIISSIIAKDDQITEMLEIVSISEAELTDIKLLMEEKDKNLAQLSEDLRRKEKEIDALVKEVKTAFSEVLELTNTVRSRDALIKGLSDGLTESQELINQIAAENTALVKKMNEKNSELERLLRESASNSMDFIKIRDQGQISKDEHARLLASVRESIEFIRRCTVAAKDGGEDQDGNISCFSPEGSVETIASPSHISGKFDVILGVVNYLTSKAEELRILSSSYATRHNRLNTFLDELGVELDNIQVFASLLPENSPLHSLMTRLGDAIATDLQEARESLGNPSG